MGKNRQVWTSGPGAKGGTMRVRAKALDQVDEDKLTLAFWLLAKHLVENRTDTRSLSREEVVRVARRLDTDDPLAEEDPGENTDRETL